MSTGEIKIEDYLHVPGVRPVDPSLPEWKAKMFREKNVKIIEEYLKKDEEEKNEAARWVDIPDWKKPLLLEKERKRKEEEGKLRQQQQLEQEEREKFESLPEWKQGLLKKKRSSVSTSNGKSEEENSENSYGSNNNDAEN